MPVREETGIISTGKMCVVAADGVLVGCLAPFLACVAMAGLGKVSGPSSHRITRQPPATAHLLGCCCTEGSPQRQSQPPLPEGGEGAEAGGDEVPVAAKLGMLKSKGDTGGGGGDEAEPAAETPEPDSAVAQAA